MAGSLALMLLLLFGGFFLNKERVPPYCRWLSQVRASAQRVKRLFGV